MAVHAENFQVSPEALAPGTEVNGWRIRERLGAGGFGAAYQVESTVRPGEFFALKMARHLADERVGREIALLMTRAVHPHVVRLHAFGRWPHPATGYLYFVMDWVRGLALHTWAETLNPSIRAAVEKLATVALTLEHLHAEGVLHRDLKPEHMLVRDIDGKPVLIDFGVGWYAGADTLTTQGMAPGTPHLRSPEAVAFWRKHGGKQGQRYAYKPTDDVYALGVSAYRVLTGHWPFPPHLERDSLFGAIESLVPPAASDVNVRLPRAVSDVIGRMMAKRPRERFSSCGEAHVALVAALTFAGAEVIESELFPWEKAAEGSQGALAPVRRVRLPEWPTAPKSSSAPPVKLPGVPDAAPRVEKKGAHPDISAPDAPPAAKAERTRHVHAWVRRAFLVLLGLVGVAAVIQNHPTRGVGEKASSPAGQKVALGSEWLESVWAAVPLRDPTPAAVVSTTDSEDSFPVNIQKVNQTEGAQVPEPPEEKPAQKGLEGARKALAVATACAVLGGCASLPPLPPNGVPCPKEAMKNMRELNLGPTYIRPAKYGADNAHRMVTVRDSEKVTWIPATTYGTNLPEGSKFIGRLWVRDYVYGRFDRAVTPEGKEYSVCMELWRIEDIPASSDAPALQNWEEGIFPERPVTEQGVGTVDLMQLYFHPTVEWGDSHNFGP